MKGNIMNWETLLVILAFSAITGLMIALDVSGVYRSQEKTVAIGKDGSNEQIDENSYEE